MGHPDPLKGTRSIGASERLAPVPTHPEPVRVPLYQCPEHGWMEEGATDVYDARRCAALTRTTEACHKPVSGPVWATLDQTRETTK